MDADIFKEMFPQNYMKKFIAQRIRIDGRQFNQLRKTIIEFSDGFTNYQYSECFISIKLNTKEVEMKQIELQQCIKIQLNFDSNEEFNNQEKNRIEKLYSNNLWDIFSQIIDCQQLLQQNGKVRTIELNVRIAGNDGSLYTHLLNCILFTLNQFKNKETQKSIISREIKSQTIAFFDSQILVDPSYFEEQNSSVITIITFADNGEKMVKKLDGKPLNFNQIQQVIQVF